MSSTTGGPFMSTIAENYIHISDVVAYLNAPANTSRLSIGATNLGNLNLLFTNPTATTQDLLGLKELYALKTNPATDTKIINAIYEKKIRKHLSTDPVGIENVLRVIYTDIPGSALTEQDRTVLHLPVRQGRTTHTVATKNTVVWKTTGIEGGDMLTKCHPSGSSTLNPSANTQRSAGSKGTRPHKEKGYEIQTAFIIIKPGAAIPAMPANGNPLDIPGIQVTVDTKARLVRHLGAANAGNTLVEYKRWHNPKHPDLDGPWSGPQTSIIP